MKKKTKEIIFGLLFLGILVFVGLDTSLFPVRLDATSTGMFTISPVSQNLFKDIPQQVHVTYYLTAKLNDSNPIYRQIEDILREYASSSRGKIRLDVVDPAVAGKQQEVEEFGLQQFPVGRQTGDNEASIINNATSGIVIQYLDRTRTVPIVQSTDTLEYDLSSEIRTLVSNRTRQVGYLVDLDDFDYQNWSNMVTVLQQYQDMQEVQRGADIPPTLDALLVFGGVNLTEFELYPIDQYLMRGGRVIFSADAVKVITNQQYGVMGNPVDKAPLFALLKTYGVTVAPELVLEHNQLALAVDQRGSKYNYWFNTYQDFVSKTNPITSRMRPLYFFWASPLTVAPPAGVTAETLIASSSAATTAKDDGGFRLNPQESGLMYTMLANDHKASYPLVVALSGAFPSYFKDKPIPKKEGVKTTWTKTEAASPASRVIVGGDSDLFSPHYIAMGAEGNFTFLSSCLNWLSNDEDLLSIRTRAAQDTLMAKIQDPDARKTAITVIIIINLVYLPLLVVIFAIFFYFLRRNNKKGILVTSIINTFIFLTLPAFILIRILIKQTLDPAVIGIIVILAGVPLIVMGLGLFNYFSRRANKSVD